MKRGLCRQKDGLCHDPKGKLGSLSSARPAGTRRYSYSLSPTVGARANCDKARFLPPRKGTHRKSRLFVTIFIIRNKGYASVGANALSLPTH